MNKQNRNRLIDNRENFDGCQMGGNLGMMGEKVKRLRSGTNWLLQNSHGDAKYSIGKYSVTL